MIGTAAALGWSPTELRAACASDFRAAVRGYNRAHSPVRPSSKDSVEAGLNLVRRVQARNEERSQRAR